MIKMIKKLFKSSVEYTDDLIKEYEFEISLLNEKQDHHEIKFLRNKIQERKSKWK